LILKWILRKYGVKERDGFSWLKTGLIGGIWNIVKPNEPSGSRKHAEFLDHLSNCQLFRKDFAIPRS
jgi:hypothetical protein